MSNSNPPFLLNEYDIIDGYAEEHYFRTHSLIIVTPFETEKEAEQLKQQILSDQKLRRMVEERIKQMEHELQFDFNVSGKVNLNGEIEVDTLQKLLEESRKK